MICLINIVVGRVWWRWRNTSRRNRKEKWIGRVWVHKSVARHYGIFWFSGSDSGSGASFQLFLGGPNFFPMPPDYWKIGKKQHFVCSNLTLFIVPFFLFSLFFFFLSLFSFFSFFFFFFFLFFSFFLFPWGRWPSAPKNDASAQDSGISRHHQ